MNEKKAKLLRRVAKTLSQNGAESPVREQYKILKEMYRTNPMRYWGVRVKGGQLVKRGIT